MEIDVGFTKWWDEILNLHYADKNNQKQKVPVIFFTQERWYRSRYEGVRDDNGKIRAPIIVISRTGVEDDTDGPLRRTVADIQQPLTIAKKANTKSSRIKNLTENRSYNIDPDLPIHEMYTIPIPDHYRITYEVAIWASYMEEMNSFIEKIGQEFSYKSKKLFPFEVKQGMKFYAFKTNEITDESNLEDWTESERLIRKEYTFEVSSYIVPESNQKKSPMRRYLSQTKLVFKQETALSDEELEELIGK